MVWWFLGYRSSIIAPRSSLLGRNKSHGTLLKMAQTNQLPVIPTTDDRGNENSRPETQPITVRLQWLKKTDRTAAQSARTYLFSPLDTDIWTKCLKESQLLHCLTLAVV